MKKTAWIALLCTATLLAACGEKKPPDTTPDTSNGTSTPAETTTEGSRVFTLAPGTGEPSVSSSASTTPPDTTPATTPPKPAPGAVTLSIPVPSFDLRGLTEAEADAFFSDAVFVGDSISMHFRNHVIKERKINASYFAGAQFLTAGNFGAGNALLPVSKDSVHPLYQGEQMQVWDSIPKLGAKKVFLLFGLNDVARFGIDKTVQNIGTIIEKVQNNVPDAQFYILSATYVQKGGERGQLTSANLRALNEALIAFCAEQQHAFINLADALADAEGYLKKEYCNDGYVHHNTAGHTVWAKVLRGFAAARLKP